MKSELDKKLVEDFPILYQDRYKTPQETIMCFGFECGDGWEILIRKLSEKIEGYNRVHLDSPVVAVQVKEKFGTLRFYVSNNPEEVCNWIDEAETESEVVCEQCGKLGKLRGEGWLYTMCDECWEKFCEERVE